MLCFAFIQIIADALLLPSCSHCVSHSVKKNNNTNPVQYSCLLWSCLCLLQVSWMDWQQFRKWNPASPSTLKWSPLSLTQSTTLACAHPCTCTPLLRLQPPTRQIFTWRRVHRNLMLSLSLTDTHTYTLTHTHAKHTKTFLGNACRICIFCSCVFPKPQSSGEDHLKEWV